MSSGNVTQYNKRPKGSFVVSPPVSGRSTLTETSTRGGSKTQQKKGHSEYHCLDDVCILVRVPSSSTYMSMASLGPTKNTVSDSDQSFKDYAKAAKQQGMDGAEIPDYSQSVVLTTESNYMVDPDQDDQYYFGASESRDQEQNASTPEIEPEFPLIYEDCFEFSDTITFAKDFVEQLITESEANVEDRYQSITELDTKQEDQNEESNFMSSFKESNEDFSYIETKRSFTSWPTINTFTVETGAYKIDEYLASFETEEDWMYVIYYQGTNETLCSDLYRYQAIFSLPTWRYPVSQATASIYFTIEVCKVKPKHCEVDVTYRFETFGHARRPGFQDFQEQWLHYILDSKIRLFKTVTY